MDQSPPISILFVHHRSELGGAPASLSYLIRELVARGCEAHVYCPSGPAADLFRAAGAVVHTGPVAAFTHIWASVYRGRRWLLFARELARLPRHVVRFRRALRAHRFDVVHLNDSPLVPAALVARRAGLPIVWHLRSSLPFKGGDLRSRLVRRVIRKLAAATIAITSDVAASYAVGSTVVPNPVDLERFRPRDPQEEKRALGLPTDRPVVSYFGFLYPSKGFREFMHAAAALRSRGIDATYVMIGGAVRSDEFFRTALGRVLRFLDLARNYEREAYELAQDLGLRDAIRFVPFTHDTSAFYGASEVVVAPSRGPELGRPVLEAAASGVAVIASGSRTGAGVIFPGRTGVVVDFETEKLTDEIAGLLADERRRRELGRAAREYAETSFAPDHVARRVEEIYRSILPRRDRVPVLFVHHRPQLGGAPASLATLIANLSDRYEPHVFTPAGPAAELFASAGATVHTGPAAIFAHGWDNPYRGLRWLVLARELRFLPGHVRALGALLRRYRFPIVHLNDSPLLPAARVAHRHGARVVWHLRSALAAEGRDRRSRAISALMDRWGDAAIAIDRDVADRFRIRLPVTIVHNSVVRSDSAATDLDDAKRRLGLPGDRVVIGFAGFVRRQKGWPELVDAAEILLRRGVPAHFVIMGGGVRPPEFFRTVRGRALAVTSVLVDEESAIKQVVADKGLKDNFSFYAFTTETEAIYRALDIVTFPNQGVGLGRPVLEAAAYGKPVVASGSRDGAGVLIPEHTGLLLDDATPTAIADALQRLIEGRELRERLGRNAARHAAEEFDARSNARAVERVYEELLGLEPAESAIDVSPRRAAV